ncbi:hypothetical protein OCU04_004155 [Sclerotinia nivalis]|uniref:PKS/mFAS DH domain-containing protein n=1 Tax=Sclerotinia nivalis TaxID=352851 RepID=A0A9X0DM59_9HELO|nr:hypothetical protein OCU04_004155 [Sclerotinia nivalis]
MKLLGSKYHKLLVDELQKQELTRQNPKTSFFSSVVGKEITNSAELGPEYWVANLTSMVRFNSAISRLQVERPNGLFLEIGPHSTLSGPLRQISAVGGSECRYVPTMLRGKPCTDTFLSALGQLYQNGITVDWDAVVTTGKVLTNLPRYAWDHTGSFWYEPRVSKEWRFRQFGHHRLLGLRIPESSSLEPLWRNMLTIEDEPWLGDHRIRSDVVFPFAGYIAMAGEAVRQLTGIEAGYRVKHAVAQSALVIQESQSVEVLTSLRLVKLGDVANSTWFEFRISSYNGSTWVKHCEGQIKACTEPLLPSRQIQNELLPRKIISSRWYQAMDKIGVVYGPNFQALQDIVSSTKENLAAAKIVHDDHNEDPAFLLHPVAIDNCLQLLLVALAKGIGRDFGDLRMPTIIEDLYISNGAAQMNAIAWSKGSEDLAVECIADGRLALQLKGLKLTPMDNDRLSKAESHAAARLEWLPDFNMIDHAPLFTPPPSVALETRMQEEMTLLCILESAEIIKGVQPCQEHFSKFRDWLDLEIDRAKQGTYPLLEKESIDFVALPSTTRKSMIEDRYQKLLGLQKSSVAIGIKRIYDNMEAIFSGSRDTLDILMQDDVLTEIYNAVSFGKGDFFRLMAHTRLNLRILEVGAGTGGTTEMILRNLIRPGGHPPYSLYTFTDISAGFFTQGKERFSYAPNMDYKVFDISQSPINQGFEAESYDVVLAPNVIHATPSLNETLMNLQLLLKPGGLLVLTELCAVVRTPNYIFGNFSGWWLGEEDGRPQEPYVSVERWDEELKRAGFSGVDTAVRDAEEPYHYCAAIVSRKLGREEGASDIGDVRPVTIICEDSQQELSQHLLEDIQPPGMTGTICQLGELPPADQDLIILVDLAKPFFECVTESRFSAFQAILNNHKSGRILWATNLSQVKSKNPRSAQVIGIARSIRAESAIPFYTLEIDSNEPNFSSLVKQVLDKIRRCKDTEILAPDKEYVVDEGVVKIGRYQTFSVDQDRLAKPSSIGSSVVKSLEIALPGSLDSLSWTQEVGSEIMEPDKVEIENHAVGINFKDVLYAMGVLKTGTESAPLGLEIAGVVRRVGSAVQNLAVGDRVLAMPPDACFKTLVTVPQSLVERIPFNLSFEEAATMPIVYTTVIECLINIGMLEKGQVRLQSSRGCGLGSATLFCRTVFSIPLLIRNSLF